jgi:hypothetical protein
MTIQALVDFSLRALVASRLFYTGTYSEELMVTHTLEHALLINATINGQGRVDSVKNKVPFVESTFHKSEGCIMRVYVRAS